MHILDSSGTGNDDMSERIADYRRYLESIRASLPSSVYDFAAAVWHYDFSDPRCPHDSWVEGISITEPASGTRKEKRAVEINVRLLGAFHDGHINLRYVGVHSYSLDLSRTSSVVGHGDWLLDEVRMSPTGTVIHEIRFSKGGAWTIECDDIQYEWSPLESQPRRQ